MSWVEVHGARWRWLKVDGAGWRWVHGLVITIWNYPCLEVSVKVSRAFESLTKFYFWEFHFFQKFFIPKIRFFARITDLDSLICRPH